MSIVICDNCEKKIDTDFELYEWSECDDPILEGKWFCDVDCAEAYFDKHK